MLVKTGLTALSLGLLATATAEAQTWTTVAASRQLRDEEDFNLVVQFGVGEFHLRRDQGSALYRANLVYDEEAFHPVQDYSRATRTLRIGVEGRDRDLRLGKIDKSEQELDVTVAGQVPLTLDFKFGAGRADIDLGGVALRRATIRTGASENHLDFSRPTTAPCESLDVQVGAVEFVAERLGNANCEQLSVKGAAGSLTLDFTGEWQRHGVTHADVILGLGDLVLRFPSHLGVSIELDRLLASFDPSGFVKSGDRYVSTNYEDTAAHLDIDLRAILGDVDVVWVPR